MLAKLKRDWRLRTCPAHHDPFLPPQPRRKAAQCPPIGNFLQEWITACKGSLKTSCDFGYASDMIEMMLLGLVAYRVGKKITYDGATGRVTDSAEANDLLRHTYRKGWTLEG